MHLPPSSRATRARGHLDPDCIRSILVVKLGGLGDVFLSTIVLESLSRHFGRARIDYLVETSAREAVANHPRVAEVLTLDRRRSGWTPIRDVRRRGYDMVIDLFGNPRSAILTRASGARHRVGLDYGWRKHLYSIVGNARRERLHGAEVNLQALVALGVPCVEPHLEFHFTPEDRAGAEAFWRAHALQQHACVVGLLPAGSWPSKRCEPQKLAEIAAALVEGRGARILVVWGPADEEDAREIERLAGKGALLAPRASLARNMALLARCNAIVATDSGPMHVASSLSVPILTLYGPTAPEGAYGSGHASVRNESLPCLVCNRLQCPVPGHPCMRELPVASVLEAFDRMLRNRGVKSSV